MLCQTNTTTRYAIVSLLAISLALLGSVANADEQPAQPPSLDDELFGDLGDDSLDSDVEQELFGDDPMPPKETQGEPNKPLDQRRIDAWNELLEEELAESAVDEAQNPLLGIARSMRLAENLIEQSDSGEKTQKIQSEIIADIDTLLKQAKKKCQSCSSKCQSTAQRKPTQPPKKAKPKEGSPKPKPATTSNAKPGSAEGEMPDMGEMMAVIKEVWGELPEQERQEMLQLSVEEFLPKYADMIERYFRRLAEDRKATP
jgi:hypothetical protein